MDTDPVGLAGVYHSGSLRGECCMEQKTGRKLLGFFLALAMVNGLAGRKFRK